MNQKNGSCNKKQFIKNIDQLRALLIITNIKIPDL